jgi:ubiquitin carboxyl-terminal hydrolase 10
LHEEAVEVMKKISPSAALPTNSAPENEEAGWMEVGHKQKAATTRTTDIIESPITKIFGGKLRSVLSVPGLPNSVTLEPYTPLQLDIHTPDVNSVVDALKHLTTPESLQGDFKSPKGPSVTATKQVFIETLPPVLILHLKRFQYDNTGGTQKIWKKVAYPLELEIPREAMSKTVKRPSPPKYRLIGVVYHHGSSAQGGHYTADVLRQDAKHWIRLDDTSIQMVAPKDVAVDVKDIGKYNGLDGDEQDGWVGNWEQVNGSGSSGQNKGAERRYVGKDSRTAYILFYQRI